MSKIPEYVTDLSMLYLSKLWGEGLVNVRDHAEALEFIRTLSDTNLPFTLYRSSYNYQFSIHQLYINKNVNLKSIQGLFDK